MLAGWLSHGSLTHTGYHSDSAAPAAIVLEAGGIITDLAGRAVFPFDLNRYQGAKVPFLAAGPAAHGELLREITSCP
jgi:3'-phosphoadenosine 5'-phosphosulfate (PAPS) 3'-phosphatase